MLVRWTGSLSLSSFYLFDDTSEAHQFSWIFHYLNPYKNHEGVINYRVNGISVDYTAQTISSKLLKLQQILALSARSSIKSQFDGIHIIRLVIKCIFSWIQLTYYKMINGYLVPLLFMSAKNHRCICSSGNKLLPRPSRTSYIYWYCWRWWVLLLCTFK